MLITAFLDGQNFDPEAKRVMGVAFEMARAALRLADRADPSTEILVKRIIALAKEGMPSLLCEWALEDIRKSPHSRDIAHAVAILLTSTQPERR
jgi:hypothetical protein